MTRIHSGALLTRPPGRKYLQALEFAELSLPEPLPTARTLRRWKEHTPEPLTLALVVPAAAAESPKGPLRFDDAMEDAFARTVEATEILNARFVVLATKGDVTTGPRDRDLIAAWVARWEGTGRAIVWQPTGLWDPELARPFAHQLGVSYGFDPLATEPPNATLIYARMRAMGSRRGFGETQLVQTVDALAASGSKDAFVAICSPKSFTEAQRLAALAAVEA